jgi:hypothetical protein
MTSKSLCDMIQSSFIRADKNDVFFNGKTAIATEEFDGTKASFDIALGNITSNTKLREYGLSHKLQLVLRSLYNLFEAEEIAAVSGIMVAHSGNFLIKIINNGEVKEVNQIFYLDIADLYAHPESPRLKNFDPSICCFESKSSNKISLCIVSILGITLGLIVVYFNSLKSSM